MQNSKVILEKHKQFSVSSCRPLLTINALFGLLIANKSKLPNISMEQVAQTTHTALGKKGGFHSFNYQKNGGNAE